MSEREILETSLVALLEPLRADGTLRSVVAIGGVSEEAVLESAEAGIPCALVKYTGKSGGREAGGAKGYRAQARVLLIVDNLTSLEARRQESFLIQELVEQAIVDQLPHEGWAPWDLVDETFFAQAADNTEFWVQVYETRFWKY